MRQVTKELVPPPQMLNLIVWLSIIPIIPFFFMSFLFEGVDRITTSLLHMGWYEIGATLYIAIIATLLCYAIWGEMLRRYPASLIAPFSLLVPVFGFGFSVILLGEHIDGWRAAGAILVMAGLAINLWGRRGIIWAQTRFARSG